MGFFAVVIISLLIFLGTFSRKFFRFYYKQEALDYPQLLLLVAVVIEIVNLGFDFFDTFFEANDGEGIFIVHLFNVVFGVLS